MAIEDFHNQIKGNIICKADFSCSNKSTFGDNYAIITDFPAIYIYDSGGIFGSESFYEYKNLDKWHDIIFHWVEHSKRFYFNININEKNYCQIFPLDEITEKEGILLSKTLLNIKKTNSEILFETPEISMCGLNLPKNINLPKNLKEEIKRRKENGKIGYHFYKNLYDLCPELDFDFSIYNNIGDGKFSISFESKKEIPLYEQKLFGEFYCGLKIDKNGLYLTKSNFSDCYIYSVGNFNKDILDQKTIIIYPKENSEAYDLFGDEICIKFPNHSMQEDFLASLENLELLNNVSNLPINNNIGSKNTVTIEKYYNISLTGLIKDLDNNLISIKNQNCLGISQNNLLKIIIKNTNPIEINLLDEKVILQPHDEALIIKDGEQQPFVILSDSKEFWETLNSDDKILKKINNSDIHNYLCIDENKFPSYIYYKDNKIVIERALQDTLYLNPYETIVKITSNKTEHQNIIRLDLINDCNTISFLMERNLAENLLKNIKLLLLLNKENKTVFTKLPKTIMSYEYKYFLYTIFNSLYFYETYIRKNFGISNGELIDSSLFYDEEKSNKFLDFILSTVPVIKQQMENIRDKFPLFIGKEDNVFYPLEELYRKNWFTKIMNNWQYVLNNLNPIINSLGLIERELYSIAGASSYSRNRGYGHLAMGLGASLLNPLFLVSTASQAISIFSSNSDSEDIKNKKIKELLYSIVDNINNIFNNQLPLIMTKIMENIFDLREELYSRISMEYNKVAEEKKLIILNKFIKRSAALIAYCEFPSEISDDSTTRQTVASNIEKYMDLLNFPMFIPFH